jgi:hypothetical protein
MLDSAGTEVGRGVVGGDEIKLKEGTFTIRVLLAPQPLEKKVSLKAGVGLALTLKKIGEKWELQ